MPRKLTQESLSGWLAEAGKMLLVLSFISWAVMLGALIALQYDCIRLTSPQKAFGTSGEFSPKRSCADFYEFPWFKTSFQFFLNVVTALCMVTGTTAPFKNTLTLLRAIAIVLMMNSVNNFLGAYYSSPEGLLKAHTAIFFAGAVTTVVWNLLLEIVLATDFVALWNMYHH